MQEPYLALYLRDGLLVFSKKLPSEKDAREILEVGIDEVTSDTFDEASRKLGSTLLGILRLWHDDAFSAWGESTAPSKAEDYDLSDFDIAMRLISTSVSMKTKDHVQSIDALLREQAHRTKAANEFFNESWPTIRERLEKFA